MSEAPEFIRVKRRRDEDSVQALLIDEGRRKKKGRFIFKLSKTINSNTYETEDEFFTPLLKLSTDDHRHFVLERQRKRHREADEVGPPKSTKFSHIDEDTDDLPPEINQMVSEILKLTEDTLPQERPRKPSKKHFGGSNQEVLSMPSLDYVYDIYHLENMKDEDLKFYNEGNVGFVKIVNKFIDLVPDEDTDPELHSDDEDSNEENYYQNDYPEDEDDDRSILLGSDGDEESIPAETTWRKQPKEDYTELFDKLGQSDNILDSLNCCNLVDLDDDGDDDEDYLDGGLENQEIESDDPDEGEELKTNEFFPTDHDNPLAAHRDRIFGRLEKLVSES
ncbi:IWR1 (YDL115C) [Zygosaccharomyces parabailii]|uniref:ZYBA0S09-04368g1_1 n=1 Tax=Zygosaccharomyces bailii (strain CLIB 213 / ATCC 58445 / CBS 680 / BCRC 21525 / NBRC 1098 / NCYC 1416 / NRRL Y-2227) TaxID=1333698 RepID=A0A8J2XA27_ZYGB2|nr:IWR1 (YDL115C) [Zygosaccharomyces parabailii]CDF91081.1 ZYBA0S09-04368g1_1 [Zygosaccharomyces bailii CLIB 213]CDH14105.1 related to RNA polymerase II nuclear localization protein IWR1 [Zygosaccharomyces bailii ISA1307]